MVSLRPITDANREALEALAVGPDGGDLSNIGNGSARTRRSRSQALYWAVYEEETPVGFVMIADEVDGPEYIAQYLWKLFIDERSSVAAWGRQRSIWSSSTSGDEVAGR